MRNIYKTRDVILFDDENESYEIVNGLVSVLNYDEDYYSYKSIGLLAVNDIINYKMFTDNMLLMPLIDTRISRVSGVINEYKMFEQILRMNKYKELTTARKGRRRVKSFLQYLQQFGQPVDDGILLPKITQSKIAMCLNATRSTVAKEINSLRLTGFLKPSRSRELIIRN
jgi:CRP-like cAMP-binding protein